MGRGRRIYADYTPLYAEFGLRVVPTGTENGKRPLIKSWRNIGKPAMKRLAGQFPDANLGIIDGDAHGVIVVDVDDADLIDEAILQFGGTPLISKTPSGYHLWYASSGEKRKTRIDGKAIDLCGAGGFHLAPPSIRPDGREYEFVEGDLLLIPELPSLIPRYELDDCATKLTRPVPDGKREPQAWGEAGRRNEDLFIWAKEQTITCQTEQELLDRIRLMNLNLDLPLSIQELIGIARSLWRYKQGGRILLRGCEAVAVVPRSQAEELSNDALAMLVRLKHSHGWRQGRPFALAKAAATRFGLSLKGFRKARQELIKAGRIHCIWQGGNGPHDPPRFKLDK